MSDAKQPSNDKLDMQSPDLLQQNFDKLAELFPNCVTESTTGKAIDFDLLKQELNHAVVEGNKERYRLEWPGKREAIVTANLPTTKTLRPVREDSLDFVNTENIYIEGDNLEVLKLLQESYLGKIKMIYIDPPYNTGKDFVYLDNFKKNQHDSNLESGLIDEDGHKLSRLKNNPETDARYHSDWLSMIYPRVKLARNLLTDDGVIFISVDDNEVSNLRKICDEIFGAENRLSTHNIQVRYANKTLNEKNDWQPVMEYVYIYAKNAELFIPKKESEEYGIDKFIFEFKELGPGKEIIVKGRKVTVFTNGNWELIKHKEAGLKLLKETWVSGSIYSGTGNGQMVQAVIEPRLEIDGYGALYKIDGLGEDGLGYRYFVGPQTEGATRSKMFSGVPTEKLEDIQNGTALKYKSIPNLSVFDDYSPDFGNIANEGGVKYNSGKKPVKMIANLIEIANLNENDIVLDFFSGSATTAHSVMKLNAQDSLNRRFILVQLPEPVSSEIKEQKDTYSFLHSINKPPFLTELGKERIRRAAKKIKEETEAEIDYGFRVFRLDESNMQDVYYRPQELDQSKMDLFSDNVKPDRTEDDLLAQVMLDWGLPLSLKIEQVNVSGKKVFKVDDNSLFACFDTGIDETFAKEIAKEKPLRIVFKDAGFKDDTAKTNVKQLLKQLSPETEMKVL